MDKNILFGFTTTLYERSKLLKKENITELSALHTWRERRSLITKEDFKKELHELKMSENDFNRGVQKLTEEELQKLYLFVKKKTWYQIHESLFTTDVPCSSTLETALRFHIKYFEDKIYELLTHSQIIFTDSAISTLKQNLLNDLMPFAQKTLVWDVHHIMEREKIEETNAETGFSKYLSLRFGTAESTIEFFQEYPTLAKILLTRTTYMVKNIEDLQAAFEESKSQLMETFLLDKPFNISEVAMGQGDSHDGGKTVLKLLVNNKPLLFKYKNLEIGERFNQFLHYIESLDATLSFYKVKRVIGKNYTFEEFIEQESCQSNKEIEMYYTNYGLLLAVTFWLGSSDLHMENLIAHGKYPVLIDTETLLRPDQIVEINTKQSKQQIKEKGAITGSGLLPMKRYWKRQIELSALNGTKQKLPFKIRKLANQTNSDIAFQLEEAYIEGAKNIACLNGKEVNYEQYISFIKKGFLTLNTLLLSHKNEILKKLDSWFADVSLRHLLRDTQDYGNFLNFAAHPTCMVDFIEREKIMENLWHNKYVPSNLIPIEIESMLENDIPQFQLNSSEHWITCHQQTVSDCYQQTAVDVLKKHITQMNEDKIRDSYLLLRESLGDLSYELEPCIVPKKNKTVSNTLIEKVLDIGDSICQHIQIDDKSHLAFWAESILSAEKQVSLSYPSINFYNGSSGIFTFLYSLHYFYPKDTYKKILDCLEAEIFSNRLVSEEFPSAFFGAGCQLNTAYHAYSLTKDKKYKQYMENALKKLMNQVKKENDVNEWIYGRASLIALLAQVYIEFPNKQTKEILNTLTHSVKIEKTLEDIGFAHGISGILYGLLKANQILHSERIQDEIEKGKGILSRVLYQNEEYSNTWCKGWLGIQKVAQELDIQLPIKKEVEEVLQDSCICHGTFGELSDLKATTSAYIQNLLKTKILLKQDKELPSIGLFTGLAGIGYQLLYYEKQNELKNILFM